MALQTFFGIIEKHQDWLLHILKTTNQEWSWDRTLITLAHIWVLSWLAISLLRE